MTRPDIAFWTNKLQKRQNRPMVADLLDVNKLVREVQETADLAIRVRPIKRPMVMTYSDSSLCNTSGDVVPDVSDFDTWTKEEKHKVRSQAGCLVAVIGRDEEESTHDTKCSVLGWKTAAMKRVVTSTFAAETGVALSSCGCGLFCRALLANILYGDEVSVLDWNEDRVPIRLLTDCKSLYDRVLKEGSLPDDRWTAIHVCALKGVISAGPQRDQSKAGLRWVNSQCQCADGLAKEGLHDSMRRMLTESCVRLHEISAQEAKRQYADRKTRRI